METEKEIIPLHLYKAYTIAFSPYLSRGDNCLLQVFILKILKSFGINTYKKPGGGGPPLKAQFAK
jgi:hypothetical protein